MKTRLALVALATVLAAPAFAQQTPNSTSRSHHSTVPPGGIYYDDHGGNADSQLRGDRWKTNHRKQAPHHGSTHLKPKPRV